MVLDSRNKGRRGEVEVARILSAALEIEVPINYAQAALGGYDISVAGWAIEVKRAEKVALRQWQQQAMASAWKHHLMPCLWHRRNHNQWQVWFPVCAFLVVWGGSGPFAQDDWLMVTEDIGVATIKRMHTHAERAS